MKQVNGTSYNDQTPDALIQVIENARMTRTRVVLDYGNPETMESWGETFDVTGYIGRSSGQIKVPLLVYNKRSSGGGALLDHCIIRIYTSNGKKLIYSRK